VYSHSAPVMLSCDCNHLLITASLYNRSMRCFISAILCAFLILSTASAANTSSYIGDQSYYIKELLAQINRYRMSYGLNPLSFDTRLAGLAREHSSYMQRRGVLCHDNFDRRFRQSGHSSCVENVGFNYRSAQALFIAWKRSRGHDKNMLAGDIQRAGISVSGTYVTFLACD